MGIKRVRLLYNALTFLFICMISFLLCIVLFVPESQIHGMIYQNVDKLISVALIITSIFWFTNFLLVRNERIIYEAQLAQFHDEETSSLDEIVQDLPVLIVRYFELDGKYYVKSMNKHAYEVINPSSRNVQLTEINQELNISTLDENRVEAITIGNSIFQVYVDRGKKLIKLLDISLQEELKQVIQNKVVVAGFVDIDNFEVASSRQNLDESEVSLALSKQISAWSEQNKIYCRQYALDRWLLITNDEEFNNIDLEKLSVLELIRQIGTNYGIQLTASIGIAKADNVIDATTSAWPLIEIAENRGGDQVVVRDQNGNLKMFGGSKNLGSQRKQTKARAMTNLIAMTLHDAEFVYVMGHKHADADVVGAVIGIRKFCAHKGIDAKIILDWSQANEDVKKVYEELEGDTSLFIHPDTVNLEKLIAHNVIVIVVDTMIAEMTELPELLSYAQVIAIDHHRKNNLSIDTPLISYIEPYASSTCELITELLEHMEEKVTISPVYASMMLYGMIIDSQNFKIKTGKATFQAASFLRDRGADPIVIHEITRESFENYKARTNLINQAIFIKQKYAVVVDDTDEIFNRLDIAKAADTLLEFSSISVAIVCAKIKEDIFTVSARSIGDVNVQLLMEQLGGGGHFTMAAAQFEGVDHVKIKEMIYKIIE